MLRQEGLEPTLVYSVSPRVDSAAGACNKIESISVKILLLLLAFCTTNAFAAPFLLLFGGRDHRTFLGCLNCSAIDSGSVCNTIGDYGSTISDKSIWNSISDYGSTISDTSPWNTIADTPPVIVDKQGKYYGKFTVNSLQEPASGLSRFFDAVSRGALPRDGGSLQKVFCERIAPQL